MRPLRAQIGFLVSTLVIGVFGAPSRAALWVGSGTLPNSHSASASADFQLSGTTLTIILSNTSSQTSGFVNSDGLSGLFFDISGTAPTLTLTTTGVNAPSAFAVRSDVALHSGPVNLSTYTPLDNPKMSESVPYWDYDQTAAVGGLGGAVSPTVTQHFGIGAAGFGIFDGNIVDGPPMTIMPAAYDGSINKTDFDVKAVTFTLTGFTGSLSDLGSVRFQYGTALDEGNLTGTMFSPAPSLGVPEAASVGAWSGLIVLALVAHRRKTRLQSALR